MLLLLLLVVCCCCLGSMNVDEVERAMQTMSDLLDNAGQSAPESDDEELRRKPTRYEQVEEIVNLE